MVLSHETSGLKELKYNTTKKDKEREKLLKYLKNALEVRKKCTKEVYDEDK